MAGLKKYILTSILLICLLSAQAQPGQTEILWDTYGVPHIYAKNTCEMYYAYGWAQMNSHADLILKLYAQARGCAAEYWGEEYLLSDQKILLFRIPELAKNFYHQQDSEFKSYMDAFIAGMNNYAIAHPEKIGEIYKQVLPVKVEDIAGHILRVTSLEFLAGEDIHIAHKAPMAGSNAYAVAPSKSASNNSMLVINPHLLWSDFYIWFEAHLNTEGFNAYGISLVGMPSITMAFNENLGWTHTVNPIDGSDRYELTLKKGKYLLDGKKEKFIKKTVKIKVKQADGSMKIIDTDFMYSKHGPVVGQNDKNAYAVRVAGLNNTGILKQYHDMASAKNFKEFETALTMLQNPMFNIIYADKVGNIFYFFNGNIPVRDTGDYYYWKGTIDGTKSNLIWDKTHSYKDLPKFSNPLSGFIQNCNDAPWTSTHPPELDPDDFPSYFSSRGTFMRPQHAVNMIIDNPSVTFDQLVGYKHNTGMEAADRFLDDLLEAVEMYPDPLAIEAAAVLSNWDRLTETDSKGAILFAHWFDKMNGKMYENPWDKNDPNNTPSGIKEKEKAVELLITAAREVKEIYGKLDIPWGEVYRYRLNDLDFPANGGPGEYGIFRTVYFMDDKDNTKRAIAGETFIAVVEFDEKVKAKVLLSYGNATQPGNPHVGDQLEMLSEKKLRPALLEREDVLKFLEKQEILKLE